MYLNFGLLFALASIALSFNLLPDWRSLSDSNNELPQQPLDLPIASDSITPPAKISKNRELKGRFLHITDIHPDPFYKENTDTDTACHRGKDEDGTTGKYGHPNSRCDSPMTLVNATFDWIEKNLKDEIDFIVWTGDDVQHDRDNKHPRTESHIFDMNKLMVQYLDFLKSDDPIQAYEMPVVSFHRKQRCLPSQSICGGSYSADSRILPNLERFGSRKPNAHILSRSKLYDRGHSRKTRCYSY